MSNLLDFVDELNLPFSGELNDSDEYIIELNSSNDFSRLFDKISSNDKLNQVDRPLTTVDNSTFKFYYDDILLIIKADFENDSYKLVVTKNGKEN